MSKSFVASAVEIFGLIKAANAALPMILALASFIFQFAIALPLGIAIALGVAAAAFVCLALYRLRQHIFFISLEDASRFAYEQLEETVWGKAAERMHDEPSPTKTLDYMGQLLLNEGLEVFGNKPPSTLFRKISVERLKRGEVRDQCKTLQSSDSKEPDWVNLRVKRSALKRRVKRLKAGDLPEPNKAAHNPANHPAASVTDQSAELPARALSRAHEYVGNPELLKSMAAADDGELMIIETLGGTDFQVGQDNINRGQESRERAYLHAAVEELEQHGMIKLVTRGKGFSLFKVTAAGYQAVDASASTGNSTA